MTQDEHLAWAKQRALAYLDQSPPDVMNALTSMMSDVSKHDDMKKHPGIQLGVSLMMIGQLKTVDEARRFIEGFR